MKTTPSQSPSQSKARADALALFNGLVHAKTAPGKPFVHVAVHGMGASSFLADSLDAAQAGIAAFSTLGYKVAFAIFVGGERCPGFTPLTVEGGQ